MRVRAFQIMRRGKIYEAFGTCFPGGGSILQSVRGIRLLSSSPNTTQHHPILFKVARPSVGLRHGKVDGAYPR